MLTVHELHKSIGGRDLLDDFSFQLQPGEKVALVGVNGSGKSTLLRICANEVESDGGQISIPRAATVGYLPQHADLSSERTLFEELRSVFEHVDEHLRECEELAHKMAEVDHASDEYEKIAERYGELQHEIDRLGAYDINSRIDKIAAGLGFKPSDRDKLCSSFSGGWQMRIMLASLLLTNPDVLLLDEPTNHLDLETMIWLENWIRESDSSVLLVSHERKFMDALATRVFEIHEGRLAIYKGNYTEYLRLREERWAQWQREYDNQQAEIAHLQRFVDRFRYNASKAALVQSRVRAIEKIVPIPPPPKAAPSIHFRFPTPDRGNKEVFTVEGLTKAFGEHVVLDKIDFALYRGEKIALVGLNGAGKSTLLKMLGGIEQPTEGEIKMGALARAEYFAQYDTDGMHVGNTVWQEIASVAPLGHYEQARSLLGGFFFKGNDVEKPVDVLSGGERTRLRLAKMLFSGANVLLLDEPTNHLDIASRSTLESAMKDYEGSVVFVSHDRVFLNNVATRIVEIKDGRARYFPGNYTDYCHALMTLGETSPLVESGVSAGPSARKPKPSSEPKIEAPTAAGPKDSAKSAKIAPSGASAKPSAPGSQNGKPDRQAQREASRELSKEQRRIQKLVAQLEGEIATIEKRLGEIDAELTRPEIYRDHTRSTPLVQEHAKLKEQHGIYFAQWERQAAALEK